MANTDENFVDLEIRVFQQREEGYPVEITLDGHQVFPRGYLASDLANWESRGNADQDGAQLFERLFADPGLHDAWVATSAQSQFPICAHRIYKRGFGSYCKP